MGQNFQQRYDAARPSYVKVNDARFADLEPGTTVLIPSPQDIEAIAASLDDDELIDLTELRHRLAGAHDADGACPVMTGMHLRVVAELALDAVDAGAPMTEVLPIWKCIDPTSALAKKLPGGPDRINELRTGTEARLDRAVAAGD